MVKVRRRGAGAWEGSCEVGTKGGDVYKGMEKDAERMAWSEGLNRSDQGSVLTTV